MQYLFFSVWETFPVDCLMLKVDMYCRIFNNPEAATNIQQNFSCFSEICEFTSQTVPRLSQNEKAFFQVSKHLEFTLEMINFI